jgi:2-oxoglutarate dehydrogenase E2 component (dihydrolipoamide succinyltransferase)
VKVEVKIPSVGESVTEATVANIIKPNGSQVKEGDEILELETDKVNQIVYAPATGKLELKVKVEDVVKVGQTIGSIDSEKGAVSSAPAPQKETPKPAVKKESSGESLRVKEADYIADLKKKPEPLPQKVEVKAEKKAPLDNRQRRERMSKLRKVIGERLMEVKNQTAMLTTFNEVDLTHIIEVRKREQENFQKKHGVKLGFMSFFIKAAVAALQQFPDINAFIDKDEIVYCDYYDIAVAVSTDKGLMVPVLRDCDQKSFSEIEKKLKEFADQARTGAISIADMKGGTFTITNGGVFGSLLSTPILNPPQSGILGMHAIQERPVAINGKVEVRSMMYLALSYDHRIVDGKEAISFLVHMKKNLEDPSRLLLDL